MFAALRVRAAVIASIALVLLWIHLLNVFTNGSLSQFGVLPRHSAQLWHIFTAPFIHGSWQHLLNNLCAFAIFSAFILLHSIRFYFVSSVFIITVSGIGVWLFGRDALHIGASGWIYGMWSLSIALAWYDRNFKNILISTLVLLLYGGMLFGLLANNQSVSIEGHIAGVLGGILFAFLQKQLRRNAPS